MHQRTDARTQQGHSKSLQTQQVTQQAAAASAAVCLLSSRIASAWHTLKADAATRHALCAPCLTHPARLSFRGARHASLARCAQVVSKCGYFSVASENQKDWVKVALVSLSSLPSPPLSLRARVGSPASGPLGACAPKGARRQRLLTTQDACYMQRFVMHVLHHAVLGRAACLSSLAAASRPLTQVSVLCVRSGAHVAAVAGLLLWRYSSCNRKGAEEMNSSVCTGALLLLLRPQPLEPIATACSATPCASRPAQARGGLLPFAHVCTCCRLRMLPPAHAACRLAAWTTGRAANKD
jgi:hypothetical protein